jgi:hypothetical protein
MSWEVRKNVHYLILIYLVSGTRVDYRVSVSSQYSPEITGTRVVLHIPTPANTSQQVVRVKMGKVRYDSTANCFNWIIKRFPGMTTFDLTASVTLLNTVVKKAWSRPPIR